MKELILGCITASVICIAAVVYVVNDYQTYKRLNLRATQLVADTELSRGDKITNLNWELKNCYQFLDRSVFFKNRYSQLADKLNDALSTID